MAITNHERVGKMLELLTTGLRPFVERELKTTDVPDWFAETKRSLADARRAAPYGVCDSQSVGEG
jgi:hypothetical protein